MTPIELLQYDLFKLCRYDDETEDFVRYNAQLWNNIQQLGEITLKKNIELLERCNND